MARARALAQILADVRVRADATNSSVDLDPVYIEWINQSAARLQNKLPASYFQQRKVFVTTTEALYPLPDDFMSLQLAQIEFAGMKRPMDAFSQRDAPRWSEAPAQAGYTVTLRYRPVPYRMVNPGDRIDGIAGWEEWLVLDVAIKALNKEESDVSVLISEKRELEAEISKLASERDGASPDRVVDVERRRPSLVVPRYRIAQDSIEILWGSLLTNGGFW